MVCKGCGESFEIDPSRCCPHCGRKLPGPARGAVNAGRPRMSVAERAKRDARVLWVRLDSDQASALTEMLGGTELDGAKLGRAALAAINKMRKGKPVDGYLRKILGMRRYADLTR